MLQGTFRIASWRGTRVAVKTLEEEVFADEDKVWVALTLLPKFETKSSAFLLIKVDDLSEKHSGMSLLYFRRFVTQMLSNFWVL